MGTDLKENAVGRAAVPDKTAGAGRNYGVDALRIFSMFLVLILHILQKGDLLSGAFNAATGTAWALEIMAYCAVDIYALISGFVGYTDKPKPFRCAKYRFSPIALGSHWCERHPICQTCDILSDRWGDFYAKGSTEQMIHAGIQETGRGNHAKRKTEPAKSGKTG